MGNHLTAGHRDDLTQVREHVGIHTSGEQQAVETGEQLSSSIPAMQLQTAVGNRAMLQMLKNGSLGGPVKAKSAGTKLPDAVKAKMESSFGTDFSDVTVHQSPDVAAMGARAVAQQNRVHFAPGQYSPASREGQSLLGHELAHVVQQRQGRVVRPKSQNQPVVFNPGLEQEADRSGEKAASGMLASSSFSMSMAPTSTPQIDSSAPVQGSFLKKIGGFAKKAAGGAMKMGKKFKDAGGLDMAKGALSGFMGAKKGGMGAGLAGAFGGAGGAGGLMNFGKSMFGGGSNEEEEEAEE